MIDVWSQEADWPARVAEVEVYHMISTLAPGSYPPPLPPGADDEPARLAYELACVMMLSAKAPALWLIRNLNGDREAVWGIRYALWSVGLESMNEVLEDCARRGWDYDALADLGWPYLPRDLLRSVQSLIRYSLSKGEIVALVAEPAGPEWGQPGSILRRAGQYLAGAGAEAAALARAAAEAAKDAKDAMIDGAKKAAVPLLALLAAWMLIGGGGKR